MDNYLINRTSWFYFWSRAQEVKKNDMASITDVSDYIIHRLNADGESDLNALKLQKLLYYVQAWHLAFYGKPLFEEKFQAWVHGPVNRTIYDRYKDQKYMFSAITASDIVNPGFEKELSEAERLHIGSVLDVYARYSPTQLEYLTHREDPWLDARKGAGQYQRSENTLDEKLMEAYYKARL